MLATRADSTALLSLLGAGAVTALGCVLLRSAAAKLRTRVGHRGLATVELAVALLAFVAPTPVSAPALACLFGAFAVWHIRAPHRGSEDCGCFGEARPADRSATVRIALTLASSLAMGAVAVLGPPNLFGLRPVAALVVVIGALLAAWAWRWAFTGPAPTDHRLPLGERVLTASASFLERRLSRRGLLQRIALTGSALSVAPLRYVLYPISALAAIDPGGCGGGLCTDGWTVFCCEINGGRNSCPSGTFPGGWWMCTSYQGGQLCAPQGVRYYVDCNAMPGSGWFCECANGSCANRRQACNIFRYGQCNTQIGGVTAVVCRMVVCENPASISGLNCSSSVAVDDAVCGQDVPCLQATAIELRGAGGV